MQIISSCLYDNFSSLVLPEQELCSSGADSGSLWLSCQVTAINYWGPCFLKKPCATKANFKSMPKSICYIGLAQQMNILPLAIL